MNKPNPKTHPPGTRFIAEGGSSVGLYELTIVEWSKNGNVKVLFQDGRSNWLSSDKIPDSSEILTKGKDVEIKLEDVQEAFSALFEKVKKAGTTVISEVCDAADAFIKDMSKEYEEELGKKEEEKKK